MYLNHNFALADAYYSKWALAALLGTKSITTNTVGVALNRVFLICSNCMSGLKLATFLRARCSPVLQSPLRDLCHSRFFQCY